MSQNSKIFSFFLVFVISFPLIYQSFHVLEHHQQSHCCEHAECAMPTPNEKNIISDFAIPIITSENIHCYICEFEYIVVTLSSLTQISIIEKSIHTNYISYFPHKIAFYSGHNKSLRAPPICLFS